MTGSVIVCTSVGTDFLQHETGPRPDSFGLLEQHLLGQRHVILTAAAAGVVLGDRYAERGRLLELDVAMDDGAIHRVAEEALHLGDDLPRECSLPVVHGGQRAYPFFGQPELAVALERPEEIAHAVEGEKADLHRNDDLVACLLYTS